MDGGWAIGTAKNGKYSQNNVEHATPKKRPFDVIVIGGISGKVELGQAGKLDPTNRFPKH
jgi:hypothetical protein